MKDPLIQRPTSRSDQDSAVSNYLLLINGHLS